MPRLSAADVAKLPAEMRAQIEVDEDGTPGTVTMDNKERARQQWKPRQAQEAAQAQIEDWRTLSPAQREARMLSGRLREALRYVTGGSELGYAELTADTLSASVAASAIRHMLDKLEDLL